MRYRISILLTALLLLLSPSAGAESCERFTTTFFGSFDTPITIIGFASSLEEFESVTQKAQADFERYHRLFNKYDSYPNLVNVRTINETAAEKPVTVEQELFELLKYYRDNYALSKKQVNVAFGSVLAIWHDFRDAMEMNPQNAELPSYDALQAANLHTNIEHMVLDENALSVYLKDPAMRLDVGAVAKGFAVELVAESLLSGPMPNFIINAGGNVRAGNPPMDGRPNWGVAIQDPDGFVLSDANTDIMDVLFLSDRSVVTSGDYQRYSVLDGVRYHHLISPETLMPPDYYRSVTVVTEDSALADLLSTTLFLLPLEEGRLLLQGMQGVEAYWVFPDRSTAMTEGLKVIARSQGATNSP